MDTIDLQIAYEKATGLLELAKQYEYSPATIANQQAYCDQLRNKLFGSLIFSANGIEFIIDEFEGGWGWSGDGVESFQCFPAACEAQQDALRYASEQSLPEQKDNYWNEYAQTYNRRDYQ